MEIHTIETEIITVNKTARTLSLVRQGQVLFSCPVLVGQNPGAKQQEGDGKTPEGCYFILRLLPDENAVGKGYYKGLHISYPSLNDAAQGLAQGRIDAEVFGAIATAYQQGIIPPQETALGGYVATHAGLSEDEPFERGTRGCIVLRNSDMDQVYTFARPGMPFVISP